MKANEDGFTLVELLAVIVILGIIVAISIPAIGSVISRADNNATEAEKELVADAARLYVTTENDEVEWKEETSGESKSEIKVSKLYEEGFLDDRGGNNEDGNKLGGEVVVTRIGSPESGYQYEYDAS